MFTMSRKDENMTRSDKSQRRFEGEFYTPLRFAKKAIQYFTKVLGKN
jgi:hypothetical protein